MARTSKPERGHRSDRGSEDKSNRRQPQEDGAIYHESDSDELIQFSPLEDITTDTLEAINAVVTVSDASALSSLSVIYTALEGLGLRVREQGDGTYLVSQADTVTDFSFREVQDFLRSYTAHYVERMDHYAATNKGDEAKPDTQPNSDPLQSNERVLETGKHVAIPESFGSFPLPDELAVMLANSKVPLSPHNKILTEVLAAAGISVKEYSREGETITFQDIHSGDIINTTPADIEAYIRRKNAVIPYSVFHPRPSPQVQETMDDVDTAQVRNMYALPEEVRAAVGSEMNNTRYKKATPVGTPSRGSAKNPQTSRSNKSHLQNEVNPGSVLGIPEEYAGPMGVENEVSAGVLGEVILDSEGENSSNHAESHVAFSGAELLKMQESSLNKNILLDIPNLKLLTKSQRTMIRVFLQREVDSVSMAECVSVLKRIDTQFKLYPIETREIEHVRREVLVIGEEYYIKEQLYSFLWHYVDALEASLDPSESTLPKKQSVRVKYEEKNPNFEVAQPLDASTEPGTIPQDLEAKSPKSEEKDHSDFVATLTPAEFAAFERSLAEAVHTSSVRVEEREGMLALPDTEEVFELNDEGVLVRRIVPRYGVNPQRSPENGVGIYEGDRIKNAEENVIRYFDARFETQFGLSRSDLESIPEFIKLSMGQQKLVFANLSEYAERGRMPYVGWVWEGIKEAIGIKQNGIPTRGSKGMESYGNIVTQLIKGAALTGPHVHEDDFEGLVPAFVDLDLRGARPLRGEIYRAQSEVNRAAHALSKTSPAWNAFGQTESIRRESKIMRALREKISPARKEYRMYETRLEAYRNAKEGLVQSMRALMYPEKEIVQHLIDLDKKVYEMQFMQTSPEEVAEIQSLPDESLWKKIGKSLVQPSNAIHFGLGFLGKTALSGSLGIFAAPLVSATLAGVKTFNKTEAELRERDRAARMGKEDTGEEALNVVSSYKTIELAGKKVEVGATQKLRSLIDEYEAHMQWGGTSADKEKILRRMRDRVQYTEDKLQLHRMNFGSAKERPVLVSELFETLAHAKLLLTEYGQPEGSKVGQRLASFLAKKESRIFDARRELRAKKIDTAIIRAGSFSLAGMLAGYLVESSNSLGKEEIVQSRSVSGVMADESVAQSTTTLRGVPEQPIVSPESVRESLPAYTIQEGDTLTKIVREKILSTPEFTNKEISGPKLYRMLLTLNKDELDQIGIHSGSIDRIRITDHINLETLHTILLKKQLD
jgi:hypothetical protein